MKSNRLLIFDGVNSCYSLLLLSNLLLLVMILDDMNVPSLGHTCQKQNNAK